MDQIKNSSGDTHQLRSPFVAIAWVSTAALSLVILILSIPGYMKGLINPSRLTNVPVEYISAIRWSASLASIMCALVSISLAGVLFWRRRNESMALFVSFYLLFYGTILGGPIEAVTAGQSLQTSYVWAAQSVFFASPTLALFSLFPTGRFVPSWTRIVTWTSVLFAPLFIVAWPSDEAALKTPIAWVASAAFLSLFSVGFYSQIHRYRQTSDPKEKLQIKWMAFSLALWLCILGVISIPSAYLQNLPLSQTGHWWAPLSGIAWWLSLNILPFSLTIAVLRYRLFEIDLIIRRTLVYASLTAVLGLVYFGSVVLLQRVFLLITGQSSPLGVVISTLVIAAIFNPFRRGLQSIIDRAFYRRKYDSARALELFNQAARKTVELADLVNKLEGVVAFTVQPATQKLWLAPHFPGSGRGNKRPEQ